MVAYPATHAMEVFHRHQAQAENQPGPSPMFIGIGAKDDGSDRPHQKARAKYHQNQSQRDKWISARKENLADRRSIIAEHHKVIHFQEIAARKEANNCPDLRLRSQLQALSSCIHVKAVKQVSLKAIRAQPVRTEANSGKKLHPLEKPLAAAVLDAHLAASLIDSCR